MAFITASFYFFYFSIVAVYVIFMPKVFSMVGYSPSEIGILFAAAPLVRFAIPFLFLKYFTFTPKVFNAALILAFVSSGLMHFSLEHFYALLFTNISLGIGMSLVIPYVESVALSYMPKESYGKVRLFGSIGFILVSLLLVKFLSSATIAVVFLNISAFATLIFGLLISKYERKNTLETKQENKSFSLKAHWPLWISLFLMQVAFGGFYNFFTIYASSYPISLEIYSISSLDMTIYLWSFGVVCEVFMLYFQAPLLQNNLLRVLQFSVGITIFRWLLLASFPENLYILFFSQSIHAFSFALYHSAAIMYLHSLYANKKLSQQFFAGIAYGLGGFLGAFGSGFIYEVSPQGLYFVASGITLMSFAFLWLESKKARSLSDWSD
ncbi:MFS transporter [Sulfurimonas sp. MAG313]|nr:MFS transporter [Sulfurimonas sp. MAG313]MDF1880430.1 MFS transporter [Sulfurimonas sp. MAG313]